MKRILTHQKKDGTEFKYKVQLESSEKTENDKLLKEGKQEKYPKEGPGYSITKEQIMNYIENGKRDFFTEGKNGTFTKVQVKKILTTSLNESVADNISSLPTY